MFLLLNLNGYRHFGAIGIISFEKNSETLFLYYKKRRDNAQNIRKDFIEIKVNKNFYFQNSL